ncbi:hypothetical protein ACQR1W_31310 [Bradyrhizobium sp. HKCCYLS1011]|uniref:hypothetical protein n=1 Tax=Bradyrhizobium sp. HKCCYLS1011 TaxID=3420733 RepID=UPI003EC0F774
MSEPESGGQIREERVADHVDPIPERLVPVVTPDLPALLVIFFEDLRDLLIPREFVSRHDFLLCESAVDLIEPRDRSSQDARYQWLKIVEGDVHEVSNSWSQQYVLVC